MAKAQVKSRKRVQDHGEVFTNEREVNAMLDMVKVETERIESRFLEPACGDGNFLIEVLRRKLAVVTSKYGRNKPDWQHYAWLAVSSIYGVELLEDNTKACRERLYKFVCDSHLFAADDLFRESVRFVLSKNILTGDALTMLDADGMPITFAEWSFFRGDRVKRRDYWLSNMLDASARTDSKQSDGQMDIFGGVTSSGYDASRSEMVPKAVREYPLRNWWEVGRDG